jgi:hypothetical protein
MPLDVVSRRFPEKCEGDQHALRHLLLLRPFGLIMKQPDDTLRVRPGSIGDGGRGAARPKSFVGQVMRAARKAGHTGTGFGRQGRNSSSRFGRGRSAALALSLRSPSRRVVMKARVVRHRGSQFRSAPLAKHVSFLRREGVTRDGADEDAAELESLRTFTRELLGDVERDLGTKLDWVAGRSLEY